MKVEILHAITKDVIHTLNDVSIYTTIEEIKAMYGQNKNIDPSRQAYRKEPRGKFLDDSVTLRSLEFDNIAKLYFKDLGPQVSSFLPALQAHVALLGWVTLRIFLPNIPSI